MFTLFDGKKQFCPKGPAGCNGTDALNCSIRKEIEKKGYFVYYNDIPVKKVWRRFFEYLLTDCRTFFCTILISIIIGILFLTDIPIIVKLIFNISSPIVNNDSINITYNDFWFFLLLVLLICIILYFIYIIIHTYMFTMKEEILQNNFSFLNKIMLKYRRSLYSEKSIVQSLDMCAEAIVHYCEKALNKKELGCAIRIFCKEQNDEVYKTIARYRLTADREDTSEPLRNDAGIVSFYKNKKNINSVIICNNHEKVLRCPLCICKNENHKKYISEEQSIMISAIKTKEIQLYGIIFLTSKKKNAFKKHDVKHMKFVSYIMMLFINALSQTVGD